jgi:hypothetical protein
MLRTIYERTVCTLIVGLICIGYVHCLFQIGLA